MNLLDEKIMYGNLHGIYKKALQKALKTKSRSLCLIEILDAFQQAMKEIEDLGVLVKDFDIGLCDFPHKREGRVVYLCWKLDEDKVSWWHDMDAGFAGRQPL